MTMPGFSGECSLYKSTRQYAVYGQTFAESSRGQILPQQPVDCWEINGRCTGIWPFYRGQQCVTGLSGAQQCCSAAGTWPYINECRRPDGRIEAVRQVCTGPCVF